MRDVRGRSGHSEETSARESSSPGKRTLVEQVYRKRSSDAGPQANAGDAVAAAGGEGGGQAPDAGLRSKVENATGADLGGARLHTGSSSAEAASSVSARAYTVGQDIHFAQGEYNPGSREGDRLIAHELAHAAQQGPTSGPPQFKLEVSQPGDAAEVEADRIADAVVGGDTSTTGAHGVTSTGPAVQREAVAEGGKGAAPAPEMETLEGSLWAKNEKGEDLPPSIEDVRQGGLNDCYLFAAMAALVHSNPAHITSMIKDNKNGTYTVTLKGLGAKDAPTTHTVSADFEKGKHGKVHGTRKALWPLIIEKAYAKEKGGTAALDTGGNSGVAADELSGLSQSRFNPQDKTADWVLATVAKAHGEKKPITFLSPAEKDAGDKKKEMSKTVTGMHFWHFYVVIEVDEKGRKIKFYNPWGYDHPNGDGWLTIDQCRIFFHDVEING